MNFKRFKYKNKFTMSLCSGYIYAIKVSDGIKIGKTIDLDERIKEYKRSNRSAVYLHTIKVKYLHIAEQTIKDLLKEYTVAIDTPNTETFRITKKQAITTIDSVVNNLNKLVLSEEMTINPKISYLEFYMPSELKQKLKKWKDQRHTDYEKVQQIVEYQEKFYSKNNVFDTFRSFVACKIHNDNKIHLIDGQHRYEAFIKLNENKKYFGKIKSLCFHIIIVNDYDEIKEKFKVLNEVKPVAQYYKLDDCPIKKNVRESIDKLSKDFPYFIKPNNGTKRVNRPFIKKCDLVENLFNICKEYNINDSYKYITKFNTYIKDKIDFYMKTYGITQKMIDKINKFEDFYIGSIPKKRLEGQLDLYFSEYNNEP